LLVAIPMFLFADDCPQGIWEDRLYNSAAATKDKPKAAKWAGFNDYRVWILAIQYAACFGVELTINGSMANYLYLNFNEDGCIDNKTSPVNECSILGKDNASIIAGLFGLMNLFARALGGLLSDKLYAKYSIRGRLIAQFVCLLGEGIALLIFSQITDLPVAIAMLLVFSVFVQASEGATFSITPFLVPAAIGQVSGIVGAGGNAGAVTWNTMISQLPTVRESYFILGFIVCASSFLTFLFPVSGVYLVGSCGSGSSKTDDATEDGSEVGMPQA